MNQRDVMRLIKQAADQNATTLDLSGLELERLPRAIGMLTSLQTLRLDRNRLTELPREIGKLTNLFSLSVQENQLTSLPDSIFGLPELRVLRVDHNQLEELPVEIWYMTRLHTLGLSGISQPDLSRIGRLTDLRTLSLRDCDLEEFPYQIGELTNLLTLDLDGNQLSELPVWFVALEKLKSLYLPLNNFTKFPAVLTRMWGLEHLNISRNSIERLPTSLANITALQTLEISGNPLQNIPAQIGVLPKLRNLYASSCTLEQLPEGLCFSPTLQRLWVGDNLLRELPQAFADLAWLKSIDLSRNRFTQVPPQLLQMDWVTHLSLNFNQIEVLPPEIGYLHRLEKLELGENRLQELPREIGDLAQLSYLHVGGNRHLNYFPETMLCLDNLERIMCHAIGIDIAYDRHRDPVDTIAYLVENSVLPQTEAEQIDASHTANETGHESIEIRFVLEEAADEIALLKEQETAALTEQIVLTDGDEQASAPEPASLEPLTLRLNYLLFEKSFLIPLGRRIVRTYLAHNNRFDSDEHWTGGGMLTYETDLVRTSSHVARLDSDPKQGGDVNLTVTGPFPQYFFSLLVAGLDRAVHHFVDSHQRQRLIACPNSYCSQWYDLDHLLADLNDNPSLAPRHCDHCAELVDWQQILLGFHAQTDVLVQQRQQAFEQRFLDTAVPENGAELQRAHHQMIALRQRRFLRHFQQSQRARTDDFPRVLLLRPLYHRSDVGVITAENLNEQEISLAPCCEMPGHWHRVGDYMHDPSATAHLRLWQSYLYVLREILPTLSYSSDSSFLLEESIQSTLEIIDAIPEPAEGEAYPTITDAEKSMGLFWQIRAAELAKSLRKVRTPEGDYLWLCDQHAKLFH